MKKVFVAALLLSGVAAYSQNLSGGLKAGVNVTNFTGGDFSSVDKKSLVGFHAGGFLNIAFGSFSIQPEALVSTQGAKVK
ncbi:MAG: PorT family protein, partial [Chitinophagaceae bacterium]